MRMRIICQRPIAPKFAVLDFDRIAGNPNHPLDKVLGRVWRKHEHYHVSPMHWLELEQVMSPRNFILERRQSEKRIRQAQPINQLVYNYVIAHQQRRLHRPRRYLVGLYEKCAQDYRQRERDYERLRILAGGGFLEDRLGSITSRRCSLIL